MKVSDIFVYLQSKIETLAPKKLLKIFRDQCFFLYQVILLSFVLYFACFTNSLFLFFFTIFAFLRRLKQGGQYLYENQILALCLKIYTVLLRLNARGVYSIFRFLGGGGRLIEGAFKRGGV